MMYARCLVAFWFVVFSSSVGRAQEWTATFPVSVLQSQLGPQTNRLMVAAAGKNRVEVESAASTLEAGLRQAAFALVMSDDGLGDVSELEDRVIVEKAAAFPIDYVIVVRVFPGASGEAPTALAMAYDKNGGVRCSLHGKAGEAAVVALPSAPAPASPPLEISSPPPVLVPAPGPQATPAAEANYDESFVWFKELVLMQVNTTRVVSRRLIPAQGKYGKEISWAEFYRIIRRGDLEQEYIKRTVRRRTLLAVGILSAVAGVALIPVAFLKGTCNQDLTEDSYCYTRSPSTGLLAASGVFAVGGAIMIVTGAVTSRNPIDVPTARKLADEHNQRLRGELGLPPEGQRSARREPRRPMQLQFALAPDVRAPGGYATARLRF